MKMKISIYILFLLFINSWPVSFSSVLTSSITASSSTSNTFSSTSLRSLPQRNTSIYLDAAIKASNWIVATAEKAPNGIGLYWSPTLVGQTSLETYNRTYDLYSGVAGVIINLLEIYKVTNNHTYLNTAIQAGDYLLSSLSTIIQQEFSTGLYHGGCTGMAVALDALYMVTLNTKYEQGYTVLINYIINNNQQGNLNNYANLRWGTAGIGLFLLSQYQRNSTKYSEYLPIAKQAGDYLINISIPTTPNHEGLKWMSGFGNIEAPNYSEGTAGIAYFLITLGNITQDNKYIQAGTKGGLYLLSIANYTDDRCLIYHDNTTVTLYYLANCHGPPGTGRFFLRLYHITKNSTWLNYAIAGANAVMTFSPWTEGPYKYNFYVDFVHPPTFWNNIGLCDGSGAVIIYFMTLYQLYGESKYLQFAINVANDAIDRKTAVTNDQWKWIITEWREDPSASTGPQVGYMQGAAGISSVFLTLDSIVNGLPNPHISLPDDFMNNNWN